MLTGMRLSPTYLYGVFTILGLSLGCGVDDIVE
jgi:hypothetical protein